VLLRVLAALGALAATAWLPAYLLPGAREMMLDAALSFLLAIVVTGLLWWASRQPGPDRLFWSLLASGWTLNLSGSIIWGVYEVATGKSLPGLSWVDLLYVARDVVVFAALLRQVRRMSRWRLVGLCAVVLAALAILWIGFFRPTVGPTEITPLRGLDFLLYAVYPIWDAVLVYVGLLALACAGTKQRRRWIGLLVSAMIFYGIANWVNFVVLITPDFTSDLPALFWLLTDVSVGIAVVYAFWADASQSPLPES